MCDGEQSRRGQRAREIRGRSVAALLRIPERPTPNLAPPPKAWPATRNRCAPGPSKDAIGRRHFARPLVESLAELPTVTAELAFHHQNDPENLPRPSQPPFRTRSRSALA